MGNQIYKEVIKLTLPNYDREKFDIEEVKVVSNEDKNTNSIYLERILVTIAEKEIFPKELWDPDERYAHWYTSPRKYEDTPIRTRATTIIEKRRRRRHKITWETKVFGIEQNPIEPWTRSPSDMLYFLK